MSNLSNETRESIRGYAELQLGQWEIEYKLNLEEGFIAEDQNATDAFLEGRVQGKINIRATLMKEVRDKGSVSAARELLRLAEATEPEFDEEGGYAEAQASE